jgi:aromatic ring-opening dioxygenase catalytic subunit (LigB family)
MSKDSNQFSRRDALTLAGGLAWLAACKPTRKNQEREPTKTISSTNSDKRMPCIFVPHGGGPWPWIPDQRDLYQGMTAYLRSIPGSLPRVPKAILCISAHWEEEVPTIMSAASPPMLYDYSGFPPETYAVEWKAPGASELAQEIEATLKEAGVKSALNADRGFDHGTFVPLSVSYPEPAIPCLQLSLVRGLDPKTHLQLGRSLSALRDRDVLILGSGMSYHNMRGFMQAMRGGPKPEKESREFDTWLGESMMLEASLRETQLVEWARAPQARECHPREEHLLPLHVVAGAAGTDAASLPYRDSIMGAQVSAVQFG